MYIEKFKQVTPWLRALNVARQTVGKEFLDKEPSNKWKAKMIISEHSPIRMVEYEWIWKEIKQWCTTHYVRHHQGCEKFVSTQRDDRNDFKYDRDSLPQGSLNSMMMTANVQSILNISHVRLCTCASQETREAWKMVIEKIREIDPILADKCVPSCVYRGRCPELKSCGFDQTEKFNILLNNYWKIDYE